MSENFDENKFMQDYAKKQRIKSLTLKAVLLFVISCALLIPLFMLGNLVDERKYNADNVIESVGKAWGNDVLNTPSFSDSDRKIFPQKQELWVDLKYQERTKAFYKVPLYTAFVDFNASFQLKDLYNFPENDLYKYLLIDATEAIDIKNLKLSVTKDGIVQVSGSMQLKGYGSFFANMKAEQNILHIKSNAKNPSFERILPNDYTIDEKGFNALYDFKMDSSKLEIGFYKGVDEYRLIQRMVKFGYFFIASTFLVLFLCELASRKNIILLQYAILGASLVLFYLMLLSFSERIGFDLAYLFSTLGIVVPISLYTLSIMEQKRFAVVIATILLILYLCLFLMLKQDEYALLIGTFVAMLGVYTAMYYTRNLNKEEH